MQGRVIAAALFRYTAFPPEELCANLCHETDSLAVPISFTFTGILVDACNGVDMNLDFHSQPWLVTPIHFSLCNIHMHDPPAGSATDASLQPQKCT